MEKERRYRVLGLMSGSSLDGLDIAYCEIFSGVPYTFNILHNKNYPYSDSEKEFLKNIPADITKDYSTEQIIFATYCADKINDFISENQIDSVDLIASHGHTIFHYPEKKKTLQIGDGKTIANITGKTVVSNFRQKDIDAGGQGAPLVPICDRYFFSNAHACLNIGGIANISFEEKTHCIGFDICAANQLLNYLANKINSEFDMNGRLAQRGNINDVLLNALNGDQYFTLQNPKSLDNNYIKEKILPLLDHETLSVEDKLATATEHIAGQIALVISNHIKDNSLSNEVFHLLVTGGGAYNTFLLSRIEKLAQIKINLPDRDIIEFKEALAMCLMGVLCIEGKPNFLPSVTGANYAVCGGEIAYPQS